MENKEEKVTSSNSEKLKNIVDEEKKSKKSNKDKSDSDSNIAKKLKHGTMATALTCGFLAVLVLLNVVTTVLFERYPINIDLTKEKIYSMTDETEEYVKNVDRDVLVTIFADEETYLNYSAYNKQAIDFLKTTAR